MRLNRRDAIAALAAAGVATGGAVVLSGDGNGGTEPFEADEVATLVAAAEVVYPDAVTGIESFVERYVQNRVADEPDHAAGTVDAIAYLNDYCRSWYDDRFAALEEATRDEALRRMNADVADPKPEGTDVERVRYYVVNELLFALYATPTGGELVGLENPPGHPGGLDSYQRGPQQ